MYIPFWLDSRTTNPPSLSWNAIREISSFDPKQHEKQHSDTFYTVKKEEGKVKVEKRWIWGENYLIITYLLLSETICPCSKIILLDKKIWKWNIFVINSRIYHEPRTKIIKLIIPKSWQAQNNLQCNIIFSYIYWMSVYFRHFQKIVTFL